MYTRISNLRRFNNSGFSRYSCTSRSPCPSLPPKYSFLNSATSVTRKIPFPWFAPIGLQIHMRLACSAALKNSALSLASDSRYVAGKKECKSNFSPFRSRVRARARSDSTSLLLTARHEMCGLRLMSCLPSRKVSKLMSRRISTHFSVNSGVCKSVISVQPLASRGAATISRLLWPPITNTFFIQTMPTSLAPVAIEQSHGTITSAQPHSKHSPQPTALGPLYRNNRLDNAIPARPQPSARGPAVLEQHPGTQTGVRKGRSSCRHHSLHCRCFRRLGRPSCFAFSFFVASNVPALSVRCQSRLSGSPHGWCTVELRGAGLAVTVALAGQAKQCGQVVDALAIGPAQRREAQCVQGQKLGEQIKHRHHIVKVQAGTALQGLLLLPPPAMFHATRFHHLRGWLSLPHCHQRRARVGRAHLKHAVLRRQPRQPLLQLLVSRR
eukprot:m.167578 g.167578  ORF g.167578 m.167578 type:complete len:439 (-) comp21131_c0_seq2:128-1444(-)